MITKDVKLLRQKMDNTSHKDSPMWPSSQGEAKSGRSKF